MWIPELPSHIVDGLSFMQAVQSVGLPSFNHKLLCLQLKLNTSQCPWHYEMSFQSQISLMNSRLTKGFQVICTQPYVYYKVFEDNLGAFELACLPKKHPRTKYINICYHHFCEHVHKSLIKIFPINTKDQIAETLSKALAQNDFTHHHQFICGKLPLQEPM